MAVCPRECSQWAETYIHYCLCSTRDTLSLALGALSVLSWGVAEVPQIIANYKHKSTQGLSLAFLITWIIGDCFNLFGCMLEPATLPTQYYMAVLYSITTLLLTSQSMYYGYIYHRGRQGIHDTDLKIPSENKENCISGGEQVKLEDTYIGESDVPSSPIPVTAPAFPRYGSLGMELYYTSARSLSKSHTPTAGSYLAQAVNHGTTLPFSIHNRHSIEEPLLGAPGATQSAPPSNPKRMLCVISAVTFSLSSMNLHFFSTNKAKRLREKLPDGVVILIGRKLLQDSSRFLISGDEEVSRGIGTILGWAMAIIYMGARLPQICLNIKRGNVEGLSPLMFIFALFGNLTYIASILVNSLEWSKIRANLPWLVDAGGCVLLDTCILVQFAYFRHRRQQELKHMHTALPTS